MMNPTITYLTATYNRAKTLPKLYSSLLHQSIYNFEWVVIDDGSIDGTQKLINKWINERKIKIRYYRKKNGGKHRAINFALPLLNSKVTLIIDSDDYLLENCSKVIENYWVRYRNNIHNIKSFVFERGISGRNDPMVKIPREIIAPRYEYIERNRMFGDYNDVFFTKELKEFRFPEFKGEKFISEGPLYFEFSHKYNSLFVNKVIAAGDYKKDGLTMNIRKLKLQNYHGALYDLNQGMGNRTPMFSRFKHGILFDYILIGSKASIEEEFNRSKHRFLIVMCLLPAILFYTRDKYNKKI